MKIESPKGDPGARPEEDTASSTGSRRRPAAEESQSDTLAMDPAMARTIESGEVPTRDAAPRISGPIGELAPGDILGEHYRVEGKIGGGAMGSVYVVEHLALGKRFAAKVVAPRYATDLDALRRLRNEARTLSAIEHENIVTVTHLDQTSDGRLFVVMELLKGEDLGDRLRRQAEASKRGEGDPWLPDEEVAHIVPQVLSALHAAHQAQVVHRDLKPDNLFLAEKAGGRAVKIVDFGISKVRGPADDLSITQTGQILGTPLYMAPEQGRSTAQVDARADLYSFGCILYQMLVGRTPFVADNVYDCVVKHATETPTRPRELRPDLDAARDALVMRCLEKKPGQRFGSAAEILEAWQGIARGEVDAAALAPTLPVGSESGALPAVMESPRRSRAVVLAGLLVAAAAGAGLVLALRGSPPPPPAAASTSPRETSPTPAAPAEPGPPPGATALREAQDDAPAAPSPEPAPRTVTRRISSTPDGAAVYRGDVLLGETPLDLDLPVGETWTVELRRRGYRAVSVELGSEGPTEVSERLRRRGPTGPALPPLAPR